jgi:hypothetical protein
MFIGHFAVAYASKRIAPRASLGWLFAACQWPDLLWPILSLAGVERFRIEPGNTAFTPLAFDYYPWSHSLVMDLAWGAALGALYFALRRDWNGAFVIGALVVSHWVLDWITHRPDMPLAPGLETRLGLGLWNSVAATIAIETAMYVAGVWIYMRTTRERDKIGLIGAWWLGGFLLASYIGNILVPAPQGPRAVARGALSMWIIIPVAAWIDRHREIAAGPGTT